MFNKQFSGHLSSKAISTEGQASQGLFCHLRLTMAEQAFESLVFHEDYLTGLINKELFLDCLH